MRRIFHRSVLLLLLGLSVTTSARADVFPVTVPGTPSAGPVMAVGGRVLWIERRGDRDALVSASAGEGVRDVLILPAVPGPAGTRHWTTLDADGDAAALERVVVAGGTRVVRTDLLRVDLATGGVRSIDGCAADRYCARCRARFDGMMDPRVAAGGAVVLAGPCSWGGTTIVQADGSRRSLDGDPVAVGGARLLVTIDDDTGPTGDLAIVDVTAGRTLGTVRDMWLGESEVRGVAIASDGTVARTSHRGAAILPPGAQTPAAVVAPAAPSSTGEDPSLEDDLVLADRTLVQRAAPRGEDGTFSTFAVTRPDGSGRQTLTAGRGAQGPDAIETLRVEHPGLWDADAGHVTWASQPCARVTIELWDLAGHPPAVPAHSFACPLPEVTARAVVYRGGRLAVPLSCPATAAPTGCATRLEASGFTARPVRMAAGARTTATLRAIHPSRLKGRRHFAVALDVDTVAQAVGFSAGVARTVRLTAHATP